MKEIFSSKKFRAVLLTALFFAGLMIYAASKNESASFPQKLLSAALLPFQQLTAAIVRETLPKESTQVSVLKQQLAEARAKLAELELLRSQNAAYKQLLKIKEERPEYDLIPANIVGRDMQKKFSSFTIDKGALDGLNVSNVVITGLALVGIITEIGPNYAIVSTVLDPAVNIAARVVYTGEIAVVSGDAELSLDGKCRLNLLSRDTRTAVGDLVVTTGLSGIFPPDMVIGVVQEVRDDSSGKTKYAVVMPADDIIGISSVFCLRGTITGEE